MVGGSVKEKQRQWAQKVRLNRERRIGLGGAGAKVRAITIVSTRQRARAIWADLGGSATFIFTNRVRGGFVLCG
ncbi:MAG: hypothetical protein ACE5I5_19735 [Candidatus Heimdallarchaeota archaeon]